MNICLEKYSLQLPAVIINTMYWWEDPNVLWLALNGLHQ